MEFYKETIALLRAIFLFIMTSLAAVIAFAVKHYLEHPETTSDTYWTICGIAILCLFIGAAPNLYFLIRSIRSLKKWD